jgi:hypothetical protein
MELFGPPDVHSTDRTSYITRGAPRLTALSTANHSIQGKKRTELAVSYVGPPFGYDLFVSYARAVNIIKSDALVQWSHHFCNEITKLLAQRFNRPGQESASIEVFIDEKNIESGTKLPNEFENAVKSSAFMMVLMSPFYPASRWCREELEHHFTSTTSDGRNGHCIVVRAQMLADIDWPDRLKDDRGNPVSYKDLADAETQLPLGINSFDDPRLKEVITKIYIEIQQRIEQYRKYLVDRRAYEARRQRPLTRPVIYLHARPQDLSDWKSARAKLRDKAVVNPDSLPQPDDDVYDSAKRDAILREYSRCDGVALLRAKNSDIRLDVMTIYRDLQRLSQEYRRNIPWAVLDQVGDEFPTAADYGVPSISASCSNPNWPDTCCRR